MPAPTTHRRQPRLVWRIAGLWMVVLALGLAIVGIVLALAHARASTMRLMAQAEALAARVASGVRENLDRELRAVFRRIQEREPPRQGLAGQTETSLPDWVEAVYVWDGSAVTVIEPPDGGEKTVLPTIREQLAEVPPTLPAVTDVGEVAPAIRTIELKGLLFASTTFTSPDGSQTTLLTQLDPGRLRTELVEPLVPNNAGLGVVEAAEATMPWRQPLSGPLRQWAIQPTQAFIREQRQAVIGQTVIYLGLTVLSFATLLVAMWFLVRLAKREVALAQLKANFVADVSHELKTPLALIHMFGETLQSGRVTDEEKRREYYGIITRESTRLTNLINNILDFSRIEAGRKEFNLAPTDVGQVVRETYDAYRPQLEHSQFEHQLNIASGLPPVDADRDAVAQAVLNLMSNAIKYSADEKYVEIDVARDTRRGKHGVLISVHDRGIGIRPEDRAHLSEGFFRSADGRVRQRGGTGLGLALVRHIVEAHHGSFDAEPRLVKGSTFRIFLPATNSGSREAGVQ